MRPPLEPKDPVAVCDVDGGRGCITSWCGDGWGPRDGSRPGVSHGFLASFLTGVPQPSLTPVPPRPSIMALLWWGGQKQQGTCGVLSLVPLKREVLPPRAGLWDLGA